MGFSLWHLVVVLLIIVLLFGTKKLRSIGGDLGSAIKGFRESLSGEKDPDPNADSKQLASHETTPPVETKADKDPQKRV